MQTQQSSENASSPNDWTPATLPLTDFEASICHVLQVTTHIARDLIGAHQAATAMLVGGDWKSIRKYFSPSSKYSQWFAYRAQVRRSPGEQLLQV